MSKGGGSIPRCVAACIQRGCREEEEEEEEKEEIACRDSNFFFLSLSILSIDSALIQHYRGCRGEREKLEVVGQRACVD